MMGPGTLLSDPALWPTCDKSPGISNVRRIGVIARHGLSISHMYLCVCHLDVNVCSSFVVVPYSLHVSIGVLMDQ